MGSRASLIGVLLLLSSTALSQSILFQDVTASSGLLYDTHSVLRFSAGVADIDRDGWLDVVFAGSDYVPPRVFRNLGGGKFAEISDEVLPADIGLAAIATFSDLDGDGWPELLLGRKEAGAAATWFELLANQQGRFGRVALPNRLAHDETGVGCLTVGDVDSDGDLDVLLMHNGAGGGDGGPGVFLRNEGGLQFMDATDSFGANLGDRRRAWTTVLADFTGDGELDLHSAVDGGPDFHARRGNALPFMDASTDANVGNVGSDMGLAVGDIENDGDLDLYSTNINYGVLYVNDGGGRFNDLGAQRGCRSYGGTTTVVGWGTAFSDLDHDADEDLVFVALNAPGRLYRNMGGGWFTNDTATSGLLLLGVALVPFDFDADGDVDLLVTDEGGSPRLYENITNTGGRHWLQVELVGAGANREAVGALVEVHMGTTKLIRAVLGGYSFVSGPPRTLHFGLGDAASVNELAVHWPDGATQVFQNLAADRVVRILQPGCGISGCEVGDLDGDCDVDLLDLSTLLVHFGLADASMEQGDGDLDGDVDVIDLERLLQHFGSSCGPARLDRH